MALKRIIVDGSDCMAKTFSKHISRCPIELAVFLSLAKRKTERRRQATVQCSSRSLDVLLDVELVSEKLSWDSFMRFLFSVLIAPKTDSLFSIFEKSIKKSGTHASSMKSTSDFVFGLFFFSRIIIQTTQFSFSLTLFHLIVVEFFRSPVDQTRWDLFFVSHNREREQHQQREEEKKWKRFGRSFVLISFLLVGVFGFSL